MVMRSAQAATQASSCPGLVVYDPTVTLSLPASVSAASGMENAIAHAVEALYAPEVGPIATGLQPKRRLESLARALPAVVARPDDIEARTLALGGAHAAGVALELASMGLRGKKSVMSWEVRCVCRTPPRMRRFCHAFVTMFNRRRRAGRGGARGCSPWRKRRHSGIAGLEPHARTAGFPAEAGIPGRRHSARG